MSDSPPSMWSAQALTLYASTTLEHFLEPTDPVLGRCALANTMVQEGITYKRVDTDYMEYLRQRVALAHRKGLPIATMDSIQKRWDELVKAWETSTVHLRVTTYEKTLYA